MTDGLDGLANRLYGSIARGRVDSAYLRSSNSRLASYLTFRSLSQSCELRLLRCDFSASLGFLWYTAHPAKFLWAMSARFRSAERWVPSRSSQAGNPAVSSCGGIFVIEGAVGDCTGRSFQAARQRICLMAPIHHHFELLGWSRIEKSSCDFWIAALVLRCLRLTHPEITVSRRGAALLRPHSPRLNEPGVSRCNRPNPIELRGKRVRRGTSAHGLSHRALLFSSRRSGPVTTRFGI